MPPDSTDADPRSLPRSFRGYNRNATEELFRRVAWDYGVLAGEHRKLKQALEDQQPPPARRHTDGVAEAQSLLAAAQKAARELREATRVECEQALRKARGRAAELEAEAERAAKDSFAVLEAAAALRVTLRAALARLERETPPVDGVSAAERFRAHADPGDLP